MASKTVYPRGKKTKDKLRKDVIAGSAINQLIHDERHGYKSFRPLYKTMRFKIEEKRNA